ncbi:MAG: T9SS type A sorting domain-containing protein [Bacteroidales bacterium]|nr:T9SS type A sorting domain-containing protein [Bacteroidales bacterium]
MVSVGHHTITVTDPLQRRVELYDIMGRCLQVAPGTLQTSLSVPCTGVYLLRVDGLPARKVVVVM